MTCARREVQHMITDLMQNGWMQIQERTIGSPLHKESMCSVAQLGLNPACLDQDPGTSQLKYLDFLLEETKA